MCIRDSHHVGEQPDDVAVLAVQRELHLGLVVLQVLGAHVPIMPCPAGPVASGGVQLEWIVRGADAGPALRTALVDCWRDVSNAGGAVGFPFLPVTDDDVAPATEAMLADLRPDGTRLLVALELAASTSEGRRLVVQGGVRIGDSRVTDPAADVAVTEGMIVRVGKRRVARVRIKD